MKFCRCEVCGKIVAMVRDSAVETICCGKAMRELVPMTGDAATEKHVPVYTVSGSLVTVKVGATEHPMADAHRVEWIAIETESGNQRQELKAGSAPQATFALVPHDKVRNIYEYCNLHGLWRG